MRNSIFPLFRRLAKRISGHGLRSRFPILNQAYRWINAGLSPRSVKIMGHLMFLDRDDSMGLSVYGAYEPVETQLIMEYVKPGSVVLDIGANIGYYTLLFARLAGEEGMVYAFEPDRPTFDLLQKNISVNGYRNVSVESVAVSNQTSRAYLRKDKFNNLDHRLVQESEDEGDVEIRTIRLDDHPDLINRSLDFIKMDIQGAEGLALEGMAGLLERSQHVKLLTEFWPKGLEKHNGGAAAFLKDLERSGFTVYEVDRQEPKLAQKSISQLLEEYLPEVGNYTNLLCFRQV